MERGAVATLMAIIDNGIKNSAASAASWLVWFYSSDGAQVVAGLLGTVTALLAIRFYIINHSVQLAQKDALAEEKEVWSKLSEQIDKQISEQKFTLEDVERLIKEQMQGGKL